MKHLALVLLVIFGANIFADLDGKCGSDASSEDSSFATTVFHSAESNCPSVNHSHEMGDCCHVGHCSHLVLLSEMSVGIQGPDEILWTFAGQEPHWRHLSPLLRPPIS